MTNYEEFLHFSEVLRGKTDRTTGMPGDLYTQPLVLKTDSIISIRPAVLPERFVEDRERPNGRRVDVMREVTEIVYDDGHPRYQFGSDNNKAQYTSVTHVAESVDEIAVLLP